MTTDSELLELAAKAAGLEFEWGDIFKIGEETVDCSDIPYAKGGAPDIEPAYWDPLTDDGDALSLAVNVKLVVNPFGGISPDGTRHATVYSPRLKREFDVPHGSDPLAATRRAIVEAAAEIGKDME